MPRNCTNNLYNFCYVYGQMTFALQKRKITAVVKKALLCNIGDQGNDVTTLLL